LSSTATDRAPASSAAGTPCWWFIGLATAAFGWAALWNGYPLLFSDSGVYIRAALERRAALDRPIYYSILILPFHFGRSLWPVVVTQSLVSALVIERAFALLAPQLHALWRWPTLVLLLVACALGTGLPWNVGQISPDFLAPLLVLALLLVLLRPHSLGPLARTGLLLLITVAQAIHYSHIPLAVATTLAIVAAAVLLGMRVRPSDIISIIVTTFLAVAAIIGMNYLSLHTVTFSPLGPILMLGRLVQSGTAQEYLATACDTAAYRLCLYRDRLPNELNAFFFDSQQIIVELGGNLAFVPEASRLVKDIIAAAPWQHLGLALQLTLEQSINISTGWGLTPFTEERAVWIALHRHFPHEVPQFLASRQQTDRLYFAALNAVHVPFGIGLLAAAAAMLVVALRRRRNTTTVILLAVATALAASAFLGGALSAGDPRYQNRMMPLVAIALAIGLTDLREHRHRLTPRPRHAQLRPPTPLSPAP